MAVAGRRILFYTHFTGRVLLPARAYFQAGPGMMKDYYIILGLPRESSKDSIKKAYRHIAKQLHPDKCEKGQDRKAFLEAKEAYETLTDDRQRKAYDAALRKKEASQSFKAQQTRQSRHTTTNRARHSHSSPLQDITFSNRQFFKSRSEHAPWQIRITLTQEEARHGGDFEATLRLPLPCPNCTGTLLFEQFFCPVCMGDGAIEKNQPLTLHIPPGTVHGTPFHSTITISGNRLVLSGIIYVREW